MATLIQFKRSSTQNDTPSVSDLSLGELAVNTYHGRFYTEKNDGSASVVEVGSNPATLTVNDAYSFPTSDGSSDQFLKTNGSGTLSFASLGGSGISIFTYTISSTTTAITGSDDNSNTLSYTAGSEQVFINGVKLVSGSDYTATNGTAVVLSAAANANDMIKILATNASSITTADLNGSEFVLDADGDTTLHADTDDQIDIKIAGADDFRFTANNFNVLSGSTLTIDSGATITNSGTANGFGLSTGKAIVLSMLFGGG